MTTDFDAVNLHLLPDEPLVSLVVEWHCPSASQTLILRHYPWIATWIGHRAQAMRLSAEDTEDAVQRGVCVLVEEAIPQFHRRWIHDPSKLFRKFLHWMEANRFREYARKLRSEQHLLEHMAEFCVLEDASQSPGEWMPVSNCCVDNVDPCTDALRHEFIIALEEFIEGLSDGERKLFEYMASQMSRADIARKLDMPYITVRRHRLRLLDKLEHFVEKHCPFAEDWHFCREILDRP